MVILVLVDSMVLPYQLAYKSQDHPDALYLAWLWMITCFFTVDICLNFCTGYIAGREDIGFKRWAVVTDRWSIAKRYIKQWFMLDLITTIPWWFIDREFLYQWNEGAMWSFSKYIRLLRVLRMLRLAKMFKILNELEQELASFHVSWLHAAAVLRAVLIILFVCHWNACLWWIVGLPKTFLDDFLPNDVQLSFEASPHWTTLSRSDAPGGATWRWIDKEGPDAYIFCFYWTLGVMRTMPPEVMPVNRVERLYVMVFMFLAFSIFAITIAQVTQMFFKTFERNRNFYEELAAVRTRLRSFDAPAHLHEDVVSFLEHLFEQRRIMAKESAMLELLPAHLKKQLKSAQVEKKLKKLDMLHAMPEKVLHLIHEIVEMRTMAQGTFLSVKGRIATGVWILASGHLHEVPSNSESNHDVIVVDEDCLKREEPSESPLTVVAVICSEVLWIEKAAFFELARGEPCLDIFLSTRSSGHTEVEPVGGIETVRSFMRHSIA